MLRQFITVLVLLTVAVWLGYPFITSSPKSSTQVVYSVQAQSSQQGRSFVVRDTMIEPGGRIGWHWHPGTVIAVVKEGTLQHYRNDCTVDAVYKAGDSFIESSGPDNAHDGRNVGTTPVVLENVYITAAGRPLAEAVDSPCGNP